ncbi:hypothetical protein E2C01_043758 [Portunus trituberculatus]|uniref:Uncharacterized protein n=1 Tax=Portunus trituberculatus TaxID=210409 RepID=A0A5B7G0E7_PORTR|nr:hypothetical protein [Portunus trituberculatus]
MNPSKAEKDFPQSSLLPLSCPSFPSPPSPSCLLCPSLPPSPSPPPTLPTTNNIIIILSSIFLIVCSDVPPTSTFLGGPASAAGVPVTTALTTAATTPPAGATCGGPTAGASVWVSSSSGGNKVLKPPSVTRFPSVAPGTLPHLDCLLVASFPFPPFSSYSRCSPALRSLMVEPFSYRVLFPIASPPLIRLPTNTLRDLILPPHEIPGRTRPASP